MGSVFIDTSIPMYAGGTPHPLREPCQRVITAIVEGRLDAVTDAEVFQEILYRYFYIGEREKGLRIFDDFDRIMDGRILPIGDDDVRQARLLAERNYRLSPRDLIHLAVMRRHGMEEIFTADTGFDAAQEVRRIDPRTWMESASSG